MIKKVWVDLDHGRRHFGVWLNHISDWDKGRSNPETSNQPAEVVAAFYDWNLDCIGSLGSESSQNSLVDGVHQDNPDLTPDSVG